jgi:TRAP-type mannitol/chloroaromatic compound transport system permease small subunit
MNTTAEPNESGFVGAVNRFILGLGHFLSWANALLIVVIVTQVTLRYGFGRGFVALEELEWHLYSVAFMFGLSYAVVTDAHVRVDLISQFLSRSKREWIEIMGILFLLLPFIVVVIIYGWEFFVASWVHNERSTAPLGLPFRWAIKSVIPLSFALFGLAAAARLAKAVNLLRGKSDADN